jgi:hypothetical protein
VRETLGEHIFNKFLENKRIEWDAYRMHVSDFEIERYLQNKEEIFSFASAAYSGQGR